MKYILYSHSGSANHGCEALVRTITAMLAPAKVMLLSDAPHEDRFYGVDSFAEICNSKSTPRRTEWIKALFKLKIQHDYHYMDAIPYFPALDMIEKDDVAISIGGDVYCYEHYPMYMYINQKIRKRAGKNILLGCSIESELLNDPILCRDLKQYDLITARESITYEAVKKVNPNTILVPDTAFMLPRIDLTLPENWIENNMVGLNISPLALKKVANPTVVMNALRYLVRHIITNTDMGVALIPHVVWENNDDREPLQELYREFEDTGRICMIDDHNCCELKGYIARCRFFIGARTHATIAAYSTGVPTLTLGYSVKAHGIAKDLFGEADNYVLSVQTISNENDILDCFSHIFDNRVSIGSLLQEKNALYKNAFNLYSSVIEQL